jgi:hypothetical protein
MGAVSVLGCMRANPYIDPVMKKIFLAMTLLAACTSPKESHKIENTSNVVGWSASAGPIRPGPDGSALMDVTINGNIDGSWHVYSLTQTTGGPTPMTITVGPTPPYQKAADIIGPTPTKAPDAEFGIETETYSGAPTFVVPVRLDKVSAAAPPKLEIKVRSQACSDKVCLPVKTATIELTPEPAKS